MRYLIDTHILLWMLMEPHKVSDKIKTAIQECDEVSVCSISFWEISLKYAIGKLSLKGLTPEELPYYAKQSGISILECDSKLFASFCILPRLAHKDPFDRMIIHTAIQCDLTLVSHDGSFAEYRELGLKLLS